MARAQRQGRGGQGGHAVGDGVGDAEQGAGDGGTVVEADGAAVDRGVARGYGVDDGGEDDGRADHVAVGGIGGDEGRRAGLGDRVVGERSGAADEVAVAGIDCGDHVIADAQRRGAEGRNAATDRAGGAEQIRGDRRAVVEVDRAAIDRDHRAGVGDGRGQDHVLAKQIAAGRIGADGSGGGRLSDRIVGLAADAAGEVGGPRKDGDDRLVDPRGQAAGDERRHAVGDRGGSPQQVRGDGRAKVEAHRAAVDGRRGIGVGDDRVQGDALAEHVAAGRGDADGGARVGLGDGITDGRAGAADKVGRPCVDGDDRIAGAGRQAGGDECRRAVDDGAGDTDQVGRHDGADIEADRTAIDRSRRAGIRDRRRQRHGRAEDDSGGRGGRDRGAGVGLGHGVAGRAGAAEEVESVARVDGGDGAAPRGEGRAARRRHAAGDGAAGEEIRGDGRAAVEADGAAVGRSGAGGGGADGGGEGDRGAEGGAERRDADADACVGRADDIPGQRAGDSVEIETVAAVDGGDRMGPYCQRGCRDGGGAVDDEA